METKPHHVIHRTQLFAGFDRLQTKNEYHSAGVPEIRNVPGWDGCRGQKFHFVIVENPLSLFLPAPHATQRSTRFLRRLHGLPVVTICSMYRDELITPLAAIDRESTTNRCCGPAGDFVETRQRASVTQETAGQINFLRRNP